MGGPYEQEFFLERFSIVASTSSKTRLFLRFFAAIMLIQENLRKTLILLKYKIEEIQTTPIFLQNFNFEYLKNVTTAAFI